MPALRSATANQPSLLVGFQPFVMGSSNGLPGAVKRKSDGPRPLHCLASNGLRICGNMTTRPSWVFGSVSTISLDSLVMLRQIWSLHRCRSTSSTRRATSSPHLMPHKPNVSTIGSRQPQRNATRESSSAARYTCRLRCLRGSSMLSHGLSWMHLSSFALSKRLRRRFSARMVTDALRLPARSVTHRCTSPLVMDWTSRTPH